MWVLHPHWQESPASSAPTVKVWDDLGTRPCWQSPQPPLVLWGGLRKMWCHINTDRTPVLLRTSTLASVHMGLHLGWQVPTASSGPAMSFWGYVGPCPAWQEPPASWGSAVRLPEDVRHSPQWQETRRPQDPLTMTQEHLGPCPHSQEPGFLRTPWRTMEAPLGATSTSEGTPQKHRISEWVEWMVGSGEGRQLVLSVRLDVRG